MLTAPTPPTRSSCGRTILSPSSVSSRKDRSPVSAMVMTGALSLLNFWTTGGRRRASSGSRLMTVETRSRTSCAAVSRLRSSLKVAMTNEVPGPETERSSSMPSTVLTTSSMGCETSVSTSSDDAPGREVRTLTVGRSTDGKRSTPSLKYAAAPTTTSESTIIAAKTGRLMQISASFCIS
jgi:hypothetical protein